MDVPNTDGIRYEKESGLFFWKKSNRKAGTLRKNGYIQIAINGRLYYAHRVAWFMTYGHWPKGVIDHIDQDKSNNSITNLRDVSPSVNGLNTSKPRTTNTSSRMLGVSKSKNKWRALIGINGKYKHLGLYETREQAHAAYLEYKSSQIGEQK